MADCALVVVDAVHGLEVQTEKTWQYANEFLLPRFMVINKIDKEHADFGHALETAASSFARSIVPFTLPIGKEGDFKGVVDVVQIPQGVAVLARDSGSAIKGRDALNFEWDDSAAEMRSSDAMFA